MHEQWTKEQWTLEKYSGHPPFIPVLGSYRHAELTRCERCAVEVTCLWYGVHPYCCTCAREVYRCGSKEHP